MMNSKKNLIKSVCVAFVVLVLMSTVFFWVKFIAETILFAQLDKNGYSCHISPTGIIPPRYETREIWEREHASYINARMSAEILENRLGIAQYFRKLEYRHSDISVPSTSKWYFDKEKGLIEGNHVVSRNNRDELVHVYIGPEGFSEKPDTSLGRFNDILMITVLQPDKMTRVVYDKKLKQFFGIQLNRDHQIERIEKGPQFLKDKAFSPIQIGVITTPYNLIHLDFSSPLIEKEWEEMTEQEKTHPYRSSQGTYYFPVVDIATDLSGRYSLILDESGRIDLLDMEMLEVKQGVGRLPTPRSLYTTAEAKPDDLLGYKAIPVSLKETGKYLGMVAASVSREGTSMKMEIFDPNGQIVKSEATDNEQQAAFFNRPTTSSSELIYYGAPGSVSLSIIKYVTENLQGPLLNLISFFGAKHFDAVKGHTAIFIMPNSFIAMFGREIGDKYIAKFLAMIIMILPALLVSGILTWRVCGHAKNIGLTGDQRRWWMVIVFAFGLAGYITYCICRPKEAMVTCPNCGKLRRPQGYHCHNCRSTWQIPELNAPLWRVTD